MGMLSDMRKAPCCVGFAWVCTSGSAGQTAAMAAHPCNSYAAGYCQKASMSAQKSLSCVIGRYMTLQIPSIPRALDEKACIAP